jgi:hypothetical protein
MNSKALLVGLFSFAVAMFVVVGQVSKGMTYGWTGLHHLISSGVSGEATVTDCFALGTHQGSHFKYVVGGTNYPGKSAGCDPGPGGKLAIVYVSDDPAVAASQTDLARRKTVLAFGLIAPFLIGLFTYWRANMRQGRSQR